MTPLIPRNGRAAALIYVAGTAGAAALEFEPITPYRPSVSSPAQLPAAGQIEFEFGGLQQRADDARRSAKPSLFKLAFTKEWGSSSAVKRTCGNVTAATARKAWATPR